MNDTIIDLYNTQLVVQGTRVNDVHVHVEKIDVTSFGDSSPKFVNGLTDITVTLKCSSAEAFRKLAALLTGEKEEVFEQPIMVGPQHRKVILE